MSSNQPANDERTHDDPYAELMNADWNIGETMVASTGVLVTFRKHYTSFAPGVETRQVEGRDEDDAIRKFLAELQAQSAS